MGKEEAIEYCYRHENEFKADMYAAGENGDEQFECLISCVRDGIIKPDKITDYGMQY